MRIIGVPTNAVSGEAVVEVLALPHSTGESWTTIRRDLQRLHVGVFTGPAASCWQTTAPTLAQREILTKLDIPAPPRILHLDTASDWPGPAAAPQLVDRRRLVLL